MSNVINLDDLSNVCGGQAAPLQLPAPQPPAGLLAPPTPFRAPPNMGFPKYSAGWWDLVRRSGVLRPR